MIQQRFTHLLSGVAAAGLTLVCATASYSSGAKPVKPSPMPLAQARRTVDMLNDVYVNSVVLTHGAYVKDPGTPAAAVVARQLFEVMKKRGWAETRWLSTTGRPFNPDARPRDKFERDAIVALRKGKARFERVEAGRLRVATLVPIVDKSCLMCHTRDKVGDPIGGLSYTIPIAK